MSDQLKAELHHYDVLKQMAFVLNPIYQTDNGLKLIDFEWIYQNNFFLEELRDVLEKKAEKDKLNARILEILQNQSHYLQKGYQHILDEIELDKRRFVFHLCPYKEYLLCTLLKKEEIAMNGCEYSVYKNFVRDFLDIILIVNEDGRILYGNKKAVEAYGYSYEELTALSIFDIRREDTREFTQRQINQALEHGIEFRSYHYKKNGTRFLAEVKSIYNQDEPGVVVSIIRDMSQIEKISKDATMFSASLDIFDDAIVALNTEGKIILWSKGAQAKLGYQAEEILNKDARILIPKELIPGYFAGIEKVRRGKKFDNYETVRIHKNGTLIDVSVAIASLHDADGSFIGTIAIYKDISEKKELARRLLESEERWRLALESGNFGVWEANLSTRRLFHYDNWGDIVGDDREEVDMCINDWEKLIHPEEVERVKKTVSEHLNGEKFDFEYQLRVKEGNYKWFRCKGRVSEWNKDGNPIRIVGTNENITDKKTIEFEIIEKCRQLEQLKREAVQANEAKTLFVANVSHEIRTPFNGILATIQLLQTLDMNEEQKYYLKLLKSSSDTLLMMINNILDISKIESNVIVLNEAPFDLHKIIKTVHQELLLTGNAKELEISFYLDPSINFQVIGDEVRLKQILTNLIGNAIKFTDKGMVSFRIKKLTSDGLSERLEFMVKDTGIGIEEAFRDRIFMNFSQGDLSTKKKFMGTGLGLAIAKQLATLMKGDISFESVVGEGSVFHFTCELKLDRESEKETGNISREDKKDTLQSDKTILYVEDNLMNQNVMENIISGKGYEYIAAFHGKEALEIIRNRKIDLVLMDIQLPEMNGFEVTRIIREECEKGTQIPIIAITAYAMREDREKCLNSGMDDYIAKPFNIEELYQLIDHHLRRP